MSLRTLVVLVSIFVLTASVASAQSPSAQAATNTPPSAQPSTTAPATAENPAPAVAPQPEKKVWTNENLPSPATNPGISTFNSPNTKPAASAHTPQPSRNRDARSYHDQIARLQDQIPPLDKQITNLEAGINGTPVNETRRYGGTRIDDWHDELARLKQKRQGILDKISALQDEARHHGIDPNQLP
jgi:hypothetical protein